MYFSRRIASIPPLEVLARARARAKEAISVGAAALPLPPAVVLFWWRAVVSSAARKRKALAARAGAAAADGADFAAENPLAAALGKAREAAEGAAGDEGARGEAFDGAAFDGDGARGAALDGAAHEPVAVTSAPSAEVALTLLPSAAADVDAARAAEPAPREALPAALPRVPIVAYDARHGHRNPLHALAVAAGRGHVASVFDVRSNGLYSAVAAARRAGGS